MSKKWTRRQRFKAKKAFNLRHNMDLQEEARIVERYHCCFCAKKVCIVMIGGYYACDECRTKRLSIPNPVRGLPFTLRPIKD